MGERVALVGRGFQFEMCGCVESNEPAHPFLDFIVLRGRVPNGHYIDPLSPLCGHKQLGLGPKFPPTDTRVLLYKSNNILDVPLYGKKRKKKRLGRPAPIYSTQDTQLLVLIFFFLKWVFSFQILQFLFFYTNYPLTST